MPTAHCETPLHSAVADVDVDVDRLFDVLTSPRRRFLLARLQNASDPLALADLADDVARWELDAPGADVPDETCEAIYISLHHVHLPKLAEAGLVTYDQDRSTADTTDVGEELTSLECIPALDD